MKKTVIFLCVFIVIISLYVFSQAGKESIGDSYSPAYTNVTNVETFESVLKRMITSYHQKYQKWPRTRNELEEYNKSSSSPVDFSSYASIELIIDSDNQITCKYFIVDQLSEKSFILKPEDMLIL